MANKIFKPKRGTYKGATSMQALSSGEFFVEVPDAGCGKGSTGQYGLKMGDGSTGYANLPYILNKGVVYDVPGSTIDYSLQGTGTAYNDISTAIGTTTSRINTLINTTGKTNSSLRNIIGAFGNAILSCAGGLTKLNNDLGKKTQVTLLNSNIGVITNGKSFAVTNPVTDYNMIFIQLWASIGSGSRKFTVFDTQMNNDAGNASSYIEGSIYYSGSYNACVGISINAGGKSLTVREVSYNGYSGIYGGAVYGLKF